MTNVLTEVAPLFEPAMLRGLSLRYRILASPMATDLADRGHATEWRVQQDE